jgi:hypothetical protein
MAGATSALYRSVVEADHRPERSFGPDDAAGGDVELFGTLVDDLLEVSPPQLVARYGELSPALRGIYLWLLTHSRKVAATQRLPLLAQAFQLLGDRPILCLDLAREFRSRGRSADALTLLRRYNEQRPWSLAGWLERLDQLVQQRELSAARSVLAEALTHNPGVAALERLRGGPPDTA